MERSHRNHVLTEETAIFLYANGHWRLLSPTTWRLLSQAPFGPRNNPHLVPIIRFWCAVHHLIARAYRSFRHDPLTFVPEKGAQEAAVLAIERASSIAYNPVCIAYKFVHLCWHNLCVRRIQQASFSGAARQKLPLIWKS
jgi:hypothetical protein